MELVEALTALSSRPLGQAVLLMSAAVHGCEAGDGKKWLCCNADGSPAPSLSVTAGWKMLVEGNTVEPMVEMHYRAGIDEVMKAKWVPMGDTYVVMIAQCTKAGAVCRPANTVLCTEEEPLASIVGAKGASVLWTTESAEGAVVRLRQVLRDVFEKQISCEDTTSAARANQLKEEGAHKLREASMHSGRAECIPGVGSGIASHATQPQFGGVALQLPGHRYGEGDLLPGGSLAPGGGMLLNSHAFRGGAAGQHARYDPIFPADVPRGGGGMQFPGPNRLFPGEPDPDHLQPPGGPSFNPRFHLGGGGGGGLPPFLR